jgi:cytochrome P450
VERLADGLLDAIIEHGSPVDLVPTLAMPLPSMVICRLLGIPRDDSAYLQERTTAALNSAAGPEAVDRAVEDLGRYMDEVTRQRLAAPGDDMFSRLLVRHVRTGDCSPEVAADLGRLMFVAGHVTTVHMIGLGILTLLRHPHQLAAMRADPGLVAPAVNELLRHLTVVRNLARVATEDVEVAGVLIRAGEGVIVSLSSANRDERRFPDPDQFDIRRADGTHVAFGYGPHLCLGAALARLELRVLLPRVFERLPGLRPAIDLDDLPFRARMTFYGVDELPVAWDRS